MIRCEFEPTAEGCRCGVCGRIVKGHNGENLTAACRGPGCRHLGESAGLIRVPCECNGANEIETPARRCSEFGRCLPVFRPKDLKKWAEQPESRLFHLCHGCERLDAKAPRK